MEQRIIFWKYRYYIALTCFCILFCAVNMWFSHQYGHTFGSPDETANYYFTKLFADSGQLRFEEPLNQIMHGLIRPRSMGFVDGYTVPGSFVGIVLMYGLLAKLFGTGIIVYLTPIIASVCCLSFYLFIKKIFSAKIAFIASCLLFVITPFWFYTVRGMFHNVLFISLLVIGLTLLVKTFLDNTGKRNILLLILSGIFIGLSLFVRTSEIIWVVAVILSIILMHRKKHSIRHWLAFAVPFFIILVSLLAINALVYGSVVNNAYSLSASTTSSTSVGITSTILTKIRLLFFPFQLDIKNIISSLDHYLIMRMPWFSIPIIIGFALVIWHMVVALLQKLFSLKIPGALRLTLAQRQYIALFFIITCWLVLYYGSFDFMGDRSNDMGLGIAYTRYWLPLFVFGLPIVVWVIDWMAQIFKSRAVRRLVAIFFLLFFIVGSTHQVLAEPNIGLLAIIKSNVANQEKQTQFFSLIEPDAVTISGTRDKTLFPGRKVIVGLSDTDADTVDMLKQLIARVPVYYIYGSSDDFSIDSLFFLKKFHFKLQQISNLDASDEVLYRVYAD